MLDRQKRFMKIYLGFLIKYIIIIIIISGFFFIVIGYTLIESTFSEHQILIKEKKTLFNIIFNEKIEDINFIVADIEGHYSESSFNQNELERLLFNFIDHSDDFYQVRLLNKDKKEIIKFVNYSGKIIQKTGEDLEDKSEYDYMQAMFVSSEQIYISSLDLNKENGVIEEPIQPVIRLVKPIFIEDELVGYLVINYNAKMLFKQLHSIEDLEIKRIYLINDQGDWLIGPPNTDVWGNVYEYESKIQGTKPDLFSNIKKATISKTMLRDGIYTSVSLQQDGELDNNYNIICSEDWYIILYSEYIWILSNVLKILIIANLFIALMLIIVFYFRTINILKVQETEEREQEAEFRLKTITDAVNEGIIMIDSKGVIQYWNQGACDIFGYTRDEMQGKLMYEILIPEQYRYNARRGMIKLDETGNGPLLNEIQVLPGLRKNGESITFEILINKILYNGENWAVGVVRDLTEMQKNIIELEKFSMAVRAAKDIIFITNKEGIIEFVNKAFEEITGYSEEEVLGKTPRFLSYFPKKSDNLSLILHSIKEKGFYNKIVFNKRKDGSNFYYDQTISVIKDYNQEIRYLVSTGRDITDRVKAEKDLKNHIYEMEETIKVRTLEFKEAKVTAQKANKAKSIFLSHMSHEIRTPLNAIIGFTQLMLRNQDYSTDQMEHLNIIRESGNHLLHIINDILEISKIESGSININKNPVNIRRLIHSVYNLFKLSFLDRGIMLYTEVTSTVPTNIFIDEQKFRQILINLISNAMKFTSDGNVKVTISNLDEFLCLEVEDTGLGIKEEELQFIFEPFIQVGDEKLRRTGTGLGLTIIKEFVQMMGGSISISSELGKGTKINAQFPLEICQGYVDLEYEIYEAFHVEVNENINICIADDQKENRLLLESILMKDNIHIYSEEDGKHIIDFIEEHPVDIIFVDLIMENIGGIEMMRKIKNELNKDVIICCLTSSAYQHDVEKLKAEGFDYVIIKPYFEQEIFEILSNHFDVQISKESSTEEPKDRSRHVDGIESIDSLVIERLHELVTIGDIIEIKKYVEEEEAISIILKEAIINMLNDFDLEKLQMILKQ